MTVCSKDLLRQLTLAAGAPGDEEEVRSLVRKTLDGVGEIRYDRLGSLLCEKRGTSDTPRVVVDGHLDEVGFMVQSITSEGYLKFVPLGGWWAHVLLGQRVDVVTGDGKVPGVIGSKPPHLLSAAEQQALVDLEKMYIDIGAATEAEARSMGVRLGDTIVPHSEFIELKNPDLLSSKAFDNRVGIGALCETLRALETRPHPNTVIGVAAAQEEVGCRGAMTASALTTPDLALVLEGTPADDLPGLTDRQAIVGKGPQIRFYDPTAISNRRLARFVEDVARECEIPVQLAVRRTGGTDAATIHRFGHGVPTVVIGVPARYIHSHVSVISFTDYENLCRLVPELVTRLDAATVAEFTRYEG